MKKTSSELEKKPLFSAKTLAKIPYMDRPPAEGGEITYLTPEEFEEKFNCRYTEDLWGDSSLAEKIQKEKSQREPTENEEKILQRLLDPLQCLAICYINKIFGHVLVATEDIPAGTILFIYAGEIFPTKQVLNQIDQDYAFDLPFEQDGKTISLASCHGGMARFMSDLPYSNELRMKKVFQYIRDRNPIKSNPNITDEFIHSQVQAVYGDGYFPELTQEIKFHHPAVKENLAFCNVYHYPDRLFGIPVTVFKLRDFPVKKKEILGFVYQESYLYWQRKQCLPKLLTQDGKMIDQSKYHFLPEGKLYQNITTIHPDQDAKKHALLARQIYDQGISAFNAKYFEDAKSHINRALDIYRILPDCKKDIGICLSTLVSCHRELKEFESALTHGEEAWLLAGTQDKEKIQEKIKNLLPNIDGFVLHNHAIAQYKKEQYDLAILELNTALEKFTEEQEEAKAKSLSALASCYRELKQLPKALTSVNEALRLAVKTCGTAHETTKAIVVKKNKIEAQLSLQTSVQAAITMGMSSSSPSGSSSSTSGNTPHPQLTLRPLPQGER